MSRCHTSMGYRIRRPSPIRRILGLRLLRRMLTGPVQTFFDGAGACHLVVDGSCWPGRVLSDLPSMSESGDRELRRGMERSQEKADQWGNNVVSPDEGRPSGGVLPISRRLFDGRCLVAIATPHRSASRHSSPITLSALAGHHLRRKRRWNKSI
jgi:hypothetical protein